MTDTNTLTPTDADLLQEWDRVSHITDAGERRLSVMRAVLAKWGAPVPASHPYAYEFSRSNEDGTHSLHIERNELQEGVLRWWERIGPPKDAITDRPIKALYETPQAHPVAAPEPHYGNGRYLGFARHNDAYSVAQVQAMFAAAPSGATQATPVDAAVQQDAERLDFLIEQRAYVVSDPSICDGYWLHYARPNGETWVQSNEHTTPRAAIDAAIAAKQRDVV